MAASEVCGFVDFPFPTEAFFLVGVAVQPVKRRRRIPKGEANKEKFKQFLDSNHVEYCDGALVTKRELDQSFSRFIGEETCSPRGLEGLFADRPFEWTKTPRHFCLACRALISRECVRKHHQVGSGGLVKNMELT